MNTTSVPRHLGSGDVVAVIGLGKMGLPMARNLARAGFDVVGYDVVAEARDRARAEGLRAAESVADATRGARLVLLVVGFDAEVLETTTGPGGVLTAAMPGAVVAVCSTVEPETVRKVEHAARPHGVHVLDTPVARGEPAAEDGSLLVLCGGDAALLDAVSAPLHAIGSDIYRLGPVGAGQVGKMLNNYLLWSCVVANHEVMRLGSRLGLSLEPLREALLMSSGANWALDTWTRSRPMPWAEEDMRVLREYAEGVGLELPLAEAVEREITDIKRRKNAWTAGGGSASSMDAFTRSLS